MRVENGFVIGKSWHHKTEVMVPVSVILWIDRECGNTPSASRIYFREAHVPHLDVLNDENVSDD